MNFFKSINIDQREIINLDHVSTFYKNDQGTFWQIIFTFVNGHQIVIYYHSTNEMNTDYARLLKQVGIE